MFFLVKYSCLIYRIALTLEFHSSSLPNFTASQNCNCDTLNSLNHNNKKVFCKGYKNIAITDGDLYTSVNFFLKLFTLHVQLLTFANND